MKHYIDDSRQCRQQHQLTEYVTTQFAKRFSGDVDIQLTPSRRQEPVHSAPDAVALVEHGLAGLLETASLLTGRYFLVGSHRRFSRTMLNAYVFVERAGDNAGTGALAGGSRSEDNLRLCAWIGASGRRA